MFTADVNNDVDRSEVMTQPCLVNCVSHITADGLFIEIDTDRNIVTKKSEIGGIFRMLFAFA